MNMRKQNIYSIMTKESFVAPPNTSAKFDYCTKSKMLIAFLRTRLGQGDLGQWRD